MADDVLIGYLHSHNLTASFHSSEMNLLLWDKGHAGHLRGFTRIQAGAMGIPEGRNDLCKALLDSDCEWLFMIDSDMGFEPMTLDLMLSIADPEEKPIIGGLCFSQREITPDGMGGMRCMPTPTILDWIEHEDGHWHFTTRLHYPANTLIKCGATGAAMLLIHRSVVETMKEEYGEHWFDRVTNTDESVMGEDVSFFFRCKEIGAPLHIHTGIRTSHYKHFWLSEQDFLQSFVAPSATERCDVIVPVLHRPKNVKPLMDSLRASTGLATAWFVCEEGDEGEIAEVKANGGEVLICSGTFAEKVNVAYELTSAPWLLLVGDDVRFRPGWLDHALDVQRRYGGAVIGTNDLANARVMRGEHATHPLISRSYIAELGASWDGPGIICHEGYCHWFVDDEICTLAKDRGVFQAALGSQVEHMHPLFGKAEDDEVYRKGQRHAAEDQRLFHRRFLKYAKNPEQLVNAEA